MLTYLPNSTTPFPSEMEIDRVKVWRYKDDSSTSINSCNYTFSTYNNEVKKSITIGGSGCSNSVSGNLILRATDGMEINGNFFVPSGSELYMDVNPLN